MQNAVELGWDFYAKQVGAIYSAKLGSSYINHVEDAIQDLEKHLKELGKSQLDSKQLKGFVAEFWHADTFNIDAACKGSTNHATVEGSNAHASVDISTNFGQTYSSKYLANSKLSVNAQAKNVIRAYHEYASKPRKGVAMTFEEYLTKYGYTEDKNLQQLISDYRNSGFQNVMTLEQYMSEHASQYNIASILTSVYSGQDRLIPSDQLAEAITYLEKQIAKESCKDHSNRVAVLTNYKEVLEKLVDRISDGQGNSSKSLSKEEAEVIATLIKDGTFKPEDFGICVDELITSQMILNQALQAGYSSAIITLVLRLAPELFKAIDYLIKNKELDINQLKKSGLAAVSATAEGFLRGSIASALTIVCKTGKMGANFTNVSPNAVGALTVIVLETIKSSVLVATGKMSAREMGTKFTKDLLVASAALAGGTVGQMLAPQLPVLGYMLGSLLGSCIATVAIDLGENFLISFCIDSGFTCFGLVSQNYVLPDEILSSMGIALKEISYIPISQVKINKIEIKQKKFNRISYNTIDLVMVRRGVIGVNTIGYV